MPTRFSRWLFVLALAATPTTPALAAEPEKPQLPVESVALPKPADIASLAIYPTQLTIRGMDDAAQLIVTATLKDG